MNKMKMIIVGIAAIFAMGANAFASPASLSVGTLVKGGEKLAAKLGLRTAGEAAVRGGAKLAAVTAEREAARLTAGAVAGDVAKHVTAGKLLAAGGATAMVVAAHETADGVQQMGEGVKEAVVANPDIADGIAKTVTAPVRWLAAGAGAVLLAFMVWFFWPWVALVRNWSKLAAARRMAAMRNSMPASGGAVDAVVMGPHPLASARPGYTHVELILIVAGFLIIAGLGIWRIAVADGGRRRAQPSVPRAGAVHQKEMVAKRAEMVAQLRAEYSTELDRHYAGFLSEVESVAAARFGDVRKGVPGVAGKFGTFSRCKDLLVSIVKDRMDNGARTEASVKRDLESDFYKGLYGAHDDVDACLVAFLEKAEAARKSFCDDLKVELGSIELPGDENFKALLTDGGDRIEECKRALSEGQVAAAVSTAVEAMGIRFTVSTAARILGKAAARMAGSTVAAGAAAVSDGPLPIGDAVGAVLVVGSTAWSLCDIYRAADVLPSELKSALYSVVDDCESATVAEAKAAGARIRDAYCGFAIPRPH